MPTSSPNIVFIMCDQMRHDCGGFAGHPLVQTPHLDRLAQSGTVFDNAYCASPVCSPARASWLTGTYPHWHGQLVNYGPTRSERPGARMRPDAVTVGDVLKGENYRCGMAGPWHLGDDHRAQHGFTDFWRAYRYQGVGHADRLFDYFEQEGVANIYGKGGDVTDDGYHMAYTTISDPRQQRTTWTIERGLEFLEADDGRPFFLFLSVKDPHPLIAVPPELLELYPEEKIELPPTWADPLEGKPAYQQRETGRLDPQVDAAKFKRMMAHYYALVTHIDAQVGRLLERLEVLDLRRDTIVAFISDHGEMLGDHGFTTKRLFYEGSVRVPCMLSWPQTLPAGRRIAAPLGGVDLMPTLLDLAGAELHHTIDGRSAAAALAQGREPEPAPVFAEISTWRAIQGASDDADELAAHVMVRDGRWKYVWNRFDEDELYDLESDPLEWANLSAVEPARREEMQTQICTMLERTGPGPYAWCQAPHGT